ncbi:Rab-GAP TBC domain-containing protein [Heracleum sosnowskyi]|uniref:Rab-GAP TBC domain-containing protein n=1 Tax=Heracleum sosnowskyi TaxID=360622 RepID=A0AAD8GN14_9APIA|nr:Rab-GAP TBC domain-containing protein [Heracleum sosnowskyi]
MEIEERERERGRFRDLRGVQWRIDLGILPSSFTSLDHLRQVTANSRRWYAALRRCLLIDPLIPKDGTNSPDLVIDNPLSQNPDSTWGRFFRNAELEKMLDQDLSRLYPEHGSYFQTPGCQGMLRRILLLWCLRHPEYGYRQGMHELLAPFLYVLHIDVQHLSEVRKTYEDQFTDKFDGFSFQESDLTYRFGFKTFSNSLEDDFGPQKSPARISSLTELDPKIQDIVLLSDAYGAEVTMSEFFAHSPSGVPHNGIPPVIEASSALYHLLAIVDSSLHSHLVELGVEPQYFALRWLRVLFGREFALEDLLIIWDEIFAADNSKLYTFAENDVGFGSGILNSLRGAFISAFAVSMILHLRSSLLATENATSCLQRLLNLPEDIKLEKLIAKSKSLQGLAIDANKSSPLPAYNGGYSRNTTTVVRGHSFSSDSTCPRTAIPLVPESYWEEKWRVLHKAEESREGSSGKKIPNRIKGWSEKVKLRLSRTESDPSPSNFNGGRRAPKSAVRRGLLKDLARQLGSEEDAEKLASTEDVCRDVAEEIDHNGSSENPACMGDDRCMNGNAGSEENSSIFSDPPSPIGGANDQGNESESSVASNLSVVEISNNRDKADSSRADPDEDDSDHNNAKSSRTDTYENDSDHSNEKSLPISVSNSQEDLNVRSAHKEDTIGKSNISLKERKLPSGKFLWFWKFGRNASDGTSEKGGLSDTTPSDAGCLKQSEVGSSATGSSDSPSVTIKGDAVDQNLLVTFRNLGQSMLENIQVIESAIQHDRGQTGAQEKNPRNGFVGRGQVTAVAALKELRKISNILSEM